jgi:menaquinone-dependent protoporphyrinogen IX oxidase
MKVLVCAASKYGATSEIAEAVADVLAESGCEVTVLPPDKVAAVDEFDAVVLGSAVYMGQWMKPRASWQNAPPARWLPGRSGCFPVARSANRPSPPKTP